MLYADHTYSTARDESVTKRGDRAPKINEIVWAQWSDGFYYEAKVTAVSAEACYGVRYVGSPGSAQLQRSSIIQDPSGELPKIPEHVTIGSDASDFPPGRLVQVLSTTFRCWTPARVVQYDLTPGYPESSAKLTVTLIHRSKQQETVRLASHRPMFKSTACKMDTAMRPCLPTPYPVHHPAFSGTEWVKRYDKNALLPVKPVCGTLIFAPYPANGQYHLAAIADNAAAATGSGDVPVIFFQDPERVVLETKLTARIDKEKLIVAPQLAHLPEKRAEDSRDSERVWQRKLQSEGANVGCDQWVAALYRDSSDPALSQTFLLGKVTKVLKSGWRIRFAGQDGELTKSVIFKRDAIKPLFFETATTYALDHTPLWPDSKKPKPQKQGKPTPKKQQQAALFNSCSRHNEPVEGESYVQKNQQGQWRVRSGWTSIRELKMFEGGVSKNPVVSAVRQPGTPGTLDASSPNYLFEWTPENRFDHPFKVPISEHFDVSWHLSKHKGNYGIHLLVAWDSSDRFEISLEHEADARRVMKTMRSRLEHARKHPEEYKGNPKTTEYLKD